MWHTHWWSYFVLGFLWCSSACISQYTDEHNLLIHNGVNVIASILAWINCWGTPGGRCSKLITESETLSYSQFSAWCSIITWVYSIIFKHQCGIRNTSYISAMKFNCSCVVMISQALLRIWRWQVWNGTASSRSSSGLWNAYIQFLTLV